MSNTNWKSLNLLDVNGMATNTVVTGRKYAKRLLNVITDEIEGAIVVRNGYTTKFSTPTNQYISNPQNINFYVFTDYSIDIEGKEIFCLIQKGEYTAINDASPPHLPITDYKQKGLWFWIRPYWNGQEYVDEWKLLNEIIITKIAEVYIPPPPNTDYRYKYRLKRGNLNVSIDNYTNWTIYNYSKGSKARILRQLLAMPEFEYDIQVFISNETYLDWEVDDIVILCKSAIDLELLEEYYNVNSEDVIFYQINNDLRIAFGSYKNRKPLIIGYRKAQIMPPYMLFEHKYPEINSDKFGKVDEYIIEQIINTKLGGAKAPFGNDRHCRVTAVLDYYEEILLYTGKLGMNAWGGTLITPYLDLSENLYRVTNIKTYLSNDGITYYLIQNTPVFHKDYKSVVSSVDGENRLLTVPVEIGDLSNKDLHIHLNAVKKDQDYNTTDGWLLLKTSGADNPTLETHSPAQNGDYCFKLLNDKNPLYLKSPLLTTTKAKVKINFAIKSQGGNPVRVQIYSAPNGNLSGMTLQTQFDINSSNYVIFNDISIEAELYIVFKIEAGQGGSSTLEIYFDNFSCYYDGYSAIPIGQELSDELGYTPTQDYVEGFEDLCILNGRVYYLNPFIADKKYNNFILVSAINKSSFLWDIATFDNFREIDKEDSNNAISLKVMYNNQILIIRDSSIMLLSDDGNYGRLLPPVYNNSCVSKDTIEIIDGIVYWCGREGIYMLNPASSLIPEEITKQTIKNLYISLPNKDKIQSTKYRKYYLIKIYNAQTKQEFILTSKGWAEMRKFHYPEIYRYGKKDRLYFLSGSKIYVESIKHTTEFQEDYGE